MGLLEIVRADRLVAVIRAPRVADPAGLASALAEAGIRCVEFTFTLPDAAEAIAAASDSGATVGAGTVLDAEQARAALDAGARFLVSPVFEPALVEIAPDVPVVLAGFTPTEVVGAMRAGAAAVKLFPARIGGPRYVADLLGPLPDAPLIPSGGVDTHTAPGYLAAGAVAVFAGSSLAPPDAVASGDHDKVVSRARQLVAALP